MCGYSCLESGMFIGCGYSFEGYTCDTIYFSSIYSSPYPPIHPCIYPSILVLSYRELVIIFINSLFIIQQFIV